MNCTVLIPLQNPQFDNPSTYVIFAQLLKQLTQMSPDTHKYVTHWLRTEYKPIWLKGLIARIQHFISRKQFPQNPPDHPTSSRTSWWIPCAARILSLISEHLSWSEEAYSSSWFLSFKEKPALLASHPCYHTQSSTTPRLTIWTSCLSFMPGRTLPISKLFSLC